MRWHWRNSISLKENARRPKNSSCLPRPPCGINRGNPLDNAEAQLLLGRLYSQTGRNESAEPILRQCLSALEQCHGPDHPQVAECLSELGAVLHNRRASNEAERLLTRALSICDIPAGWDRPAVDIDLYGETLGRMADVCCELKNPKRAEELLAKQQRLIEENYGKDDDRMAPVLSRLACVYYLMERYDDAAPLLVRSLELTERKHGPDSPETAKHIESLAGVYALQKRYDQAEKLMQRSVRIVENKYGPMHDDVASALEKYADLLRKADRHREAAQQSERVEQIRDRSSHVLDDLF
ncbi:MAG: tetratricopeptide repeat protein [Planctomycetaceae bacterium]